jgi:hypothetical protein
VLRASARINAGAAAEVAAAAAPPKVARSTTAAMAPAASATLISIYDRRNRLVQGKVNS